MTYYLFATGRAGKPFATQTHPTLGSALRSLYALWEADRHMDVKFHLNGFTSRPKPDQTDLAPALAETRWYVTSRLPGNAAKPTGSGRSFGTRTRPRQRQ